MSSMVRRAKRRVAIELREVLLGPQSGLRNDYSFIEDQLKSPMNFGPLVTVVIPVYNRKAVLARTLAALELQTYAHFEVVVTDDGSSDEPETLIEDFPKLHLRFVRQDDEGFRVAAARNNGVNAANGEIIALLDADMIPAPNWLARLIPWFEAAKKVDAEVVVVGDRQFIDAEGLTPDDVRTQFDRIRFAPRVAAPSEIQNGPPTHDWRYKMYDASRELKRHIAPYASSCHGNLACSRDLWLRVGGCDEQYSKWGGEDIELGYRMYRRGVYFVPERRAVAFHQDHPRGKRTPEEVEENRQFTASRIPFNRPQGPDQQHAVPLISVIVGPGGEGYKETVKSLLQQGGADFEVIVPAFLGPHGDRRVRAVAGESFAELLDASRGEWILPLTPGQLVGKYAFKRIMEVTRRHAVYAETYVNRDRDVLCWTMVRSFLAYRSPDRTPKGIAAFAKGRGERVILFDEDATPTEMTPAPAEPLRRLISAIDSW